MALSPDDPRLEIQEDGGGEVKTFLEHLEDLRWCLVKCVAVLLITMVVCLAGANYIMEFLLRPLEKSHLNDPKTGQTAVFLYVGTNMATRSIVQSNEFGAYPTGTNRFLQLQLVPREAGTNWMLAVEPFTNPPALPKLPLNIINITPVGGFVVAFKVALYGGIVLASPFIFYFFAQFILPALKSREKSLARKILAPSVLLFFTGVSFCYFILMPLALAASAGYSKWLGIGADQWTAESYLSFVCMFMLGMGIGFEMPIAVLTLVKIGVVDYRALAGFRRYMIVINLILGAVLTTPEIITQVLMFIPLQGLYELSVWIAWYWERRDRKRAEREPAEAQQ